MARTKKNMWLWLLAGLGVAVMVTFLIISEMTKTTPVRSASVKKGVIQAYVEERARTSLPHIYYVTMPMQGRVLPITVTEGDKVEKGDLLVKLDDADWQDATEEAREMIVAMENWVKAASAQVKASQIYEDYAQWEWSVDEKLMKGSSVSEKKGRESKRNFLDSSVKVEESQSMYHMSRALQAITEFLPAYVKRNLDRTMVRSPVNGTILKRHVWNEKVMTPGEPLLDIGNLAELEVSADILTEEAVKISIGDPVLIFGEALGSETLNGQVRLIEPEAFTKVSSLGVEEQRVTVKIRFTEETAKKIQDSGLNLGLQYRVRVKVVTDEKKGALLVPRTALFHGLDSGWKVYVIQDGKAGIKDVQVGLMNDYEAEILSGLTVEEQVIVAPESSLQEGMKVSVREGEAGSH